MKKILIAIMITGTLGVLSFIPIQRTFAFGQVVFSPTVSDYSATLRLNSDASSFQIIKYGRLRPTIDYKNLKTVKEEAYKLPLSPDPSYPGPYDEEVKYQKILLSLGDVNKPTYLPALCDILPNKDAVTKGQLFKCIQDIEWPANGKTLEQVQTEMSAYTTPQRFHIPVANSFTSPELVFNQLLAAGKDDADHDAVPDNLDNCKDVPNFSQEDANADGVGDACPPAEVAKSDTDADGLPDDLDKCPDQAMTAEDAGCPLVAGPAPAAGEAGTEGSGGSSCTLVPMTGPDAGMLMLLAAMVPIAMRRKAKG